MTKLNLFVKIDVQQLSRRFNVMRKKKNFGERKRRCDMQWVKTNDLTNPNVWIFCVIQTFIKSKPF